MELQKDLTMASIAVRVNDHVQTARVMMMAILSRTDVDDVTSYVVGDDDSQGRRCFQLSVCSNR